MGRPKSSDTPYHMQDKKDEEDSLPEDLDKKSRIVELGSIQTDPAINYSQYKSIGKGLSSFAHVDEDGRIVISLDLAQKLPDLPENYAPDVEEFAVDTKEWRDVPRMTIVIMIVGSRGDVQPYVALAKKLQADGHRVRIATHATFHDFVTGHGIEFYPIGGDPQELMSYMVKNPGLMPGMDSLLNGDISRKRTMLAEMINGCWLACHSPCPDSGQTFMADAIISNPPAFAHIHCAEALGIPLHMSFTMPWSPTTAFSHPLVNVSSSNAESGMTNYLSYAMSELLTWQGTGDLVNKFRNKTLGLHSLSIRNGPGLLDTLKVPWTYCMSNALVPKPNDWKNHIDVVGFYFLDLATEYKPPDDLAAFLAAGPPPIYIGFGSVVVSDPPAMTDILFKATEAAGVRALISAGWGGLGGVTVPPHVFILGNVPHDWLFSDGRVAAVVHHAGAGTTAIGLSKGLPTVTVPFFGDQKFWGDMIHKAGAGPEPIPQKKLDVEILTEAIKFAVSEPAKLAAKRMSEQIQHENGVQEGVDSFYRHLPLKTMRCDLDPTRVAVWWSTEYCMKLSAYAAQVLADEGKINLKDLEEHRTKDYNTKKAVTDPLTGGVVGIFWTITGYYGGIASILTGDPVNGVIKTTTTIPVGVLKIVFGIHEGFQSMPKLYGSEVRQQGKVTDFSSGVSEAAKGLFYGYYDGITGLYKEPIEGAKKDGFKGAILGAGRSFINATMKPAAGIVGVVAHPLNGAKQSLLAATKRKKDLPSNRISDGQEAVTAVKGKQQGPNSILSRFDAMKSTTKERQKDYARMAEEAMEEAGQPVTMRTKRANSISSNAKTSSVPSKSRTSSLAPSESTFVGSEPQSPRAVPPKPPSHPSRGSSVRKPDPDPEDTYERDLAEAMRLSSTSDTGATSSKGGDDDADFQRELDMAMQVSMAEQRGYERALAEQARNAKS